jgi:hypothetical protein
MKQTHRGITPRASAATAAPYRAKKGARSRRAAGGRAASSATDDSPLSGDTPDPASGPVGTPNGCGVGWSGRRRPSSMAAGGAVAILEWLCVRGAAPQRKTERSNAAVRRALPSHL